MINTSNTRLPVAAWRTPTLAEPEPVEQARLAFVEIATRWGAARGELRDLKEALSQAEADDLEDASAAYQAGTEPKKLGSKTAEVRAKIAAAEAQLPPLAAAVDAIGNEFAATIDEHRHGWIEALVEAEADADTTIETALDALRGALANKGESLSGREWLAGFNLPLARVGRQFQFGGGRVPPIRSNESGLKGQQRPETLIRLLALVTQPPADEPETAAIATKMTAAA